MGGGFAGDGRNGHAVTCEYGFVWFCEGEVRGDEGGVDGLGRGGLDGSIVWWERRGDRWLLLEIWRRLIVLGLWGKEVFCWGVGNVGGESTSSVRFCSLIECFLSEWVSTAVLSSLASLGNLHANHHA